MDGEQTRADAHEKCAEVDGISGEPIQSVSFEFRFSFGQADGGGFSKMQQRGEYNDQAKTIDEGARRFCDRTVIMHRKRMGVLHKEKRGTTKKRRLSRDEFGPGDRAFSDEVHVTVDQRSV